MRLKWAELEAQTGQLEAQTGRLGAQMGRLEAQMGRRDADSGQGTFKLRMWSPRKNITLLAMAGAT